MIGRQEILDFARELQLRPDIVEKDYVLGWLLAGMHAHDGLRAAWAFKGGTCLKKCYFETYRFSEDLDFTLTEPAHLEESFLLQAFTKAAAWIYERAGIEIPTAGLRFEVYDDGRGGRGCQGRVAYRGPLAPRGDLPRVKLDLTSNELLALEPVEVDVRHLYSDAATASFRTTAYAFEEVFAEKVRALAERLRPRDLYDVIHLYRHPERHPDRETLLEVLDRKCAFKKIARPTLASIHAMPERLELEAEWAHMLAHQLSALPPFASFWNELEGFFSWLSGETQAVELPVIPSAAAEVDLPLPAAFGAVSAFRGPLEAIRFAAANRLCAEIRYSDGASRLIEPYSLRTTAAGDVLLHAIKHATGDHRSYRLDRIIGAKATTTPFRPRYRIELTATGPLSAPSTPRTRLPQHAPAPRARRGASGPTYVIECSQCGKRFKRSKSTTALRKHKDPNGYPCSGRFGYLVDTIY